MAHRQLDGRSAAQGVPQHDDLMRRDAAQQQRFVSVFGILVHAGLRCGAGRHAEAPIIDVQDAAAHSAQRLAMPHLPGGEGRIGIAMQMQDPIAGIVGAIRVK
jgi:hypothetical protein